MNKIILEAEAKLEDKELREYVSKLDVRIKTLNDRTKMHTIELTKLRKKLNEVKDDKKV